MGEAAMDDDAFLRRLGGDDALAVELAGVLSASLPALEERLAAAVEQGQGEALARAAHAIKGAVATFSAAAAAAAAGRLEAMGRSAAAPQRGAAAAAHADLQRALVELRAHIAKRFGATGA